MCSSNLLIFLIKTCDRRALNNYVDQIWPTPPIGHFTYYLPFVTWHSMDFLLTPFPHPTPLLLLHVVIECPLMTSVLFWLFSTCLVFPIFCGLWWRPIFQELYWPTYLSRLLLLFQFREIYFCRVFQHRHSSDTKVNILITILLHSTIYY